MAAAAATEVPLLNMTTKPGTVYQFRKVSTILVKSIINCLLFLGKDTLLCCPTKYICLNQCVEYRKTIEFFIKSKGLHGYFEHNGGSLEKAVASANRSMDEKLNSGRDYTYSELGRLMEKLKGLEW